MSDPTGEPISLLVIGLLALVLFVAAYFAGSRGKSRLPGVLIIGVPVAVFALGLVNTYWSYPEPADGSIVSPRAAPLFFTLVAGVFSFLVAGFGLLVGVWTERWAR